MKNSKKITLGIICVVALALVVAAVVWGKQYYEDRYVSSDYYAMIPLDYDITPTTILSANNEDMGPGKDYNLTAFDAEGKARELSFTAYAPGSPVASAGELPKPGQYLLVKASKTIVTGWSVIDESKVPEKALTKIAGD